MKRNDTPDGCAYLIIAVIFVAAACAFAAPFYRASVQADVWQREGIEISTWEVLWGARPREQNINIKERP